MYAFTGDPLELGLIGLAELLPFVLIVLPALCYARLSGHHPQPAPHAALQNIVALNSSFSHVATIVRPAVRTAPAVGAGIVASILIFHSIIRRVGRWLFLGVVLFDVALIVFGLSIS